jgi:hypothetical protein
MTANEWGYVLWMAVLGIALYLIPVEQKSGTYDKRNWACAEYDVEDGEQVCIRMERTVNK